jgi:hypothetical protein
MPDPVLDPGPLPRRPRWREDVPLLWCDETTAQTGDVRAALTSGEAAWLTSLDGLSTLETVLATHPDASRLLRFAMACEALEDAATVPDAVRWASPSERDLAWARARALPTGVDPCLRNRARIEVVGAGQLADTVRSLLALAGIRENSPARGAAPSPTAVILADAHHPDVPRLFDGRTLDVPHVHAGARGRRAVVGPIVIPGRTSCLRCAHLHACDRDPAWPMLSIQWAQTPLPLLDPVLVHLAASHVVHLTRQCIDGNVTSDVAVEIDLNGGGIRYVLRPPHPLCGCRWPEADPVIAGVR